MSTCCQLKTNFIDKSIACQFTSSLFLNFTLTRQDRKNKIMNIRLIYIILYLSFGPCFSYGDYDSEIFPSLASYRFNWFKRQIEDSSKKPTSTDLCNEEQFKEFTFDQNVCQKSAFFTFLLNFDFEATDLENEITTCNKYEAQVKCFDEGGPKKLKCWDNLTMETMKTQFLFTNQT